MISHLDESCTCGHSRAAHDRTGCYACADDGEENQFFEHPFCLLTEQHTSGNIASCPGCKKEESTDSSPRVERGSEQFTTNKVTQQDWAPVLDTGKEAESWHESSAHYS